MSGSVHLLWICGVLCGSLTVTGATGDTAKDIVGDFNDGERGVTTQMTHTMDPGNHEMEMKMYFHAGTQETVLFKNWMVMSWNDMVWSCLGLFLVAIGYEGFRVGRQALYNSKQPSNKTQLLRESYQMSYNAYGSFDSSGHSTDTTVLDMDHMDDGSTDCCSSGHVMCSGWHWLQSFLYMVQIFVGYCLMLAVMTFNAYLFMAVILGAGLGHLLFGWMRDKYSTASEICH